MTIQALYRVQCQPCERYLSLEGWVSIPYATAETSTAALFLDFSSAYDEAVRRGWSAYPLICPDCAADLARRAKEGSDAEVRGDDPPAEDHGSVRQLEEGPRRPRRGW